MRMEKVRRTWKLRNRETVVSKEIMDYFGVSALTTRLLAGRGVTTLSEAKTFFNGGLEELSPLDLLPDLEEATHRLAEALKNNEKILIYGDYDVDGLTSVALMLRVLRPLVKNNILYYIPKRLEEGYGLHRQALAKAVKHGCRLVITVDCGVTAFEEAEFLKENGVDLIITDHHEPGPKVPETIAVVNPKLNPDYPLPHLAGVGVAYKLLQGLAEIFPQVEETLGQNLDLVALGTIADIAPLLGENRILVKEGLKVLANTNNVGLISLISSAGLEGKELGARELGYVLAPRLNACGRLGDSGKGLRLLLANEPTQARAIAMDLERMNQERQEIEQKVYLEAVAKVEEAHDLGKVLVIGGEGWHPGVIGIVASRLTEKYYRPAVLLSLEEETGKGSARSIPGFHLYDALSRCSTYLLRFGGHQMAAGLEVKRDKLEAFQEVISGVAETLISEETLTPCLAIDEEILLPDVTRDLIAEIDRLAPFGAGNPRPVLACRGVDLIAKDLVGRERNHLKIRVGDASFIREGIGFNLGSIYEELSFGKRIDLAFQVGINDWNNEAQLILKDLVPVSGDYPDEGEAFGH